MEKLNLVIYNFKKTNLLLFRLLKNLKNGTSCQVARENVRVVTIWPNSEFNVDAKKSLIVAKNVNKKINVSI